MISFQGEVGLFMVEEIPVQANDVCITAFMFRMAIFTGGVFCHVTFAVKTGAFFDVFGDLFMTIEAEFNLKAFTEGGMAKFAVVFIFLMPLDYLARHNNVLNGLSLRLVCLLHILSVKGGGKTAGQQAQRHADAQQQSNGYYVVGRSCGHV